MSDSSYQPKAYHKQGGDEYIIANGGALTIEAGGVLAIEAGTVAGGQVLTIGTGISTPVVFGTNELVEWHGRGNSATSSAPLLRCRMSAPASTNVTTGAAVAGQFQAYGTDTSDVADLHAVEGHVGIKAACTVISRAGSMPEMMGGWFKLEDLGFDLTLTGSAAALALGMQWNAGTTLTGVVDWIFCAKEGGLSDPADAWCRVVDTAAGGWANFLFDVPASTPAVVAGGNYSSAEGYFIVKVGANTYRMPFYTGTD